MAENKMLEELEIRLKAKNIYDLRQIARGVGVQSPTAGKKERLLKGILDIAAGIADPATPTTKGAPPKSEEYDRYLVSDILRCREISLSSATVQEEQSEHLLVSSDDKIRDPLAFRAEGLLEKSEEKWFIRVDGCRETSRFDIFVNQNFVAKYDLREGDFVCGECRRNSLDEIAGLASLISVNGNSVDPSAPMRRKFENLTPAYPDRRFKLERSKEDITGRMIDLFSPVGAGQRALIISPRGTEKTELLKSIAFGLEKNQPQLKIIFVIVDAGAEQVADYQRAFPSLDIFASPMDYHASCHVRTAKLALEYAKRQTEYFRDVVLILDDLNKLVRAYNSCGKQVSTLLETSALDGVKKFIAAARNAEEGGSLTIISSLSISNGDFIDQAVYYSLKDICNMKASVSASALRGESAFAIDINSCECAAERNLLTAEEYRAAGKLRSISETSGSEACVKLFENSLSNAQLCEELNKNN